MRRILLEWVLALRVGVLGCWLVGLTDDVVAGVGAYDERAEDDRRRDRDRDGERYPPEYLQRPDPVYEVAEDKQKRKLDGKDAGPVQHRARSLVADKARQLFLKARRSRNLARQDGIPSEQVLNKVYRQAERGD